MENRGVAGSVVAPPSGGAPHELPRRPLFRRVLGRLVRLAPVPSSFSLAWVLLSRDLEAALPRSSDEGGYEYRWGGPAEIEWISNEVE